MNLLVISSFCAVILVPYLTDGLGVAPAYFKLLTELMSVIALLMVIGRIFGGARVRLDWRYGIFFGLLLFVILFGFMAQSVESGPIVSGLRFYLKPLPFLLLPAVYPFTERQLKVQLGCLFLLFAVQAPVAFYQKYFQFTDHWNTGDFITGTLGTSGALTLLMIGGITALVVLYLRSKVALIPFLIGVGLLLAPTTINETKITIMLLPLVILLPVVFMPRGERSMRKLVPILATGGVCAAAFLATYAYFAQFSAYGEDIGSFIERGGYKTYLYNEGDRYTSEDIGRLDTLVYAFKRVKQDPLVSAFGLGAGNASVSPLKEFNGKYASYYRPMGIGQTQVTYLLWEVGFVGLFAYLFFYFIAFRDALLLARSNTPFAPLGQLWATLVVVLGLALLYASIFGMDEVIFFFWFYSGVVASKTWELRRAVSPAPAKPLAVKSLRTPAAAT